VAGLPVLSAFVLIPLAALLFANVPVHNGFFNFGPVLAFPYSFGDVGKGFFPSADFFFSCVSWLAF